MRSGWEVQFVRQEGIEGEQKRLVQNGESDGPPPVLCLLPPASTSMAFGGRASACWPSRQHPKRVAEHSIVERKKAGHIGKIFS